MYHTSFFATCTYFAVSDVETTVLFLDGSAVMLTHQCSFVRPDRSCSDVDDVQLQFFTRRQQLTRPQVKMFDDMLSGFCLQDTDVDLHPGTRV